MKRTWFTWLLGLLGGATTGCNESSPTRSTNGSGQATLPAQEAPERQTGKTEVPEPKPPNSDPFEPIRLGNSGLVPPPADLFRNGMHVIAASSGPVNTLGDDRAFFTDRRFHVGGNSGRLFYHRFLLRNPHDPMIPERHVWFLRWSPLDDGDRAQRLPERSGLQIKEVTTDGKVIQVQHTANQGSETLVDTLIWKGDAQGKGRFELHGANARAENLPTPVPFEVERDHGYRALSARKPADAAAAFEKALRLNPDDPAAQFALGVAWEELTLRDPVSGLSKAIDAYSRAIAADPKRTAAYQRRAAMYERQKQLDLAIADLTLLISLDPGSWENLLDRARLQARNADYAKAMGDAKEAARRAPTEVPPLEMLARYQYQSGQWDDAIATGRRTLLLEDSSTAIRITMACAFARLGRQKEALETYADARSNGVTNSERRWGIRELAQALKRPTATKEERAALLSLTEQLRGTEELEALDDSEGF